MEKINIKKYIDNKRSVKVLSLTSNKDILKQLKLDGYEIIKNINDYSKNVFSDNQLLVIVMDSKALVNDSIFKKNYSSNNIMLLILNGTEFTDYSTDLKNMLFSYGYKYFGLVCDEKVHVFIYDISEYKDSPEWLNNKNWANPELWEK
tara:strand:- start:3238 stop:3681 length:444 start_codon:yes stop_codon:yes gene_type:complete